MNKKNRLIANCAECHERLLLNPENNLCMPCENRVLKNNVSNLKEQLKTALREKNEIYEKLCRERSTFVTGGV